jgi:uncharacterized membrane protein
MAIYVLVGRDLQLLDAGSALRQRYMAVPWWMLAHGFFGALALLLAPFQFSSRLRQRHIRVHRFMGRLYLLGAIVAATASVPIAIILGPPELVMAATMQATGWVLTTSMAWYCVRTGRIRQHREWMIRSYPFAMVFVIVRVILSIPAIDSLGPAAFISVVWTVIALALFVPSIVIAWQASLASRPARLTPTG